MFEMPSQKSGMFEMPSFLVGNALILAVIAFTLNCSHFLVLNCTHFLAPFFDWRVAMVTSFFFASFLVGRCLWDCSL